MTTQGSTSAESSKSAGNILVSLDSLNKLLEGACCIQCKSPSLTASPTAPGFGSKLELFCDPVPTKRVDSSANALRSVVSARNCGFGYSNIVRFFSGMAVSQPMHLRTYQKLLLDVLDASNLVRAECFSSACQSILALYMENSNYTDNDVIDISISLDGTWHRRGYSSHYGVGVAIETETDLVIDVQLLLYV